MFKPVAKTRFLQFVASYICEYYHRRQAMHKSTRTEKQRSHKCGSYITCRLHKNTIILNFEHGRPMAQRSVKMDLGHILF